MSITETEGYNTLPLNKEYAFEYASFKKDTCVSTSLTDG
jgi:hypothetical protein